MGRFASMRRFAVDICCSTIQSDSTGRTIAFSKTPLERIGSADLRIQHIDVRPVVPRKAIRYDGGFDGA